MVPRCLVALLAALILAPAAHAQAAPQNLHAFLLRATEPEDPTREFARTPSFAWNPVPGAISYEFQLASSRSFSENAIAWETETLKTPVTTIPLTLPWMTGSPYSFYARVRGVLPGDEATAWSQRYGFRMRSPRAPQSLSSGPEPDPRNGALDARRGRYRLRGVLPLRPRHGQAALRHRGPTGAGLALEAALASPV
ncbi:MAG: hypothetical protein H0U90_08385 [Actinobacteria bacterium]|nr:hypothetical protein [Actinomycetota bacterium]